MKKKSPTELTLDYWRQRGFTAIICEYWLSYGRGGQGVRKDFGGFADVIVWNKEWTIAVNATTESNISERKKKFIINPDLQSWITSKLIKERSGRRKFFIQGWKEKGKPLKYWQSRLIELVKSNGIYWEEVSHKLYL